MFSVPFALGGGSGGFNVPLTIPMSVGASTLNVTSVIDYGGTWRSSPVIVMTGPITNPVILNTTTNEKLDFTGTVLGSGTTYTIDTRYGYKTVVDQTGANKIADLTNTSDLATFHLAADPEATDGLNSIQVTGTGVTSATSVFVQYYERFVGV